MTEKEKRKLKSDYAACLILLGWYSKNRHLLKMGDKEYYNYLDTIMDEMNIIKKKLKIQENN